MTNQTPQQRIDNFIGQCQIRASQYCLDPRPAGERLLVGLLHDGHESTCPTLVSWPITWQAVEVGKRYEKKTIDGCGATYENRVVTVLALIPTHPVSTELYEGTTLKIGLS